MDKNENIPSVTRFKGSVNKRKTGLSKTNSSVKARPPRRYVAIPPETFTPGKICEIKKIEKELKSVFLKNGFTSILA